MASQRFIRKLSLGSVVLLVGVAGIVFWRATREGEVESAGVRVPVSEESCLGCHGAMTGFSPYHDPQAIGCASCHAGDVRDTTEAGAHAGMHLVPGNLTIAEVTCGEGCHADLVDRVHTSMMATARGIVAVDRWVFGEQETPNGTDGFGDLGDSHADEHLRQLCGTCHLDNVKADPGPVTELSRGGGCVACHIAYGPERGPDLHPRLTVAISNDHCFGCHSRSGRISTNFEGWHETLMAGGEMPADPAYRLLQDGRVFERHPEDVHHTAGMACIDCHTAAETMGDGEIYAHQNEATEVRCTTCHHESVQTLGWRELDLDARKVILIRSDSVPVDRRFLRIERTGRALTNAFLDGAGMPVLEGKLDGRRRPLRPPAPECTRPGHDRVSCQSCHSAWAPQCVGCHTQLDEDGLWQEFASDFFAEPPTLGIRTDQRTGEEIVEPFIPGMVMTLGQAPRSVETDVAQLAREGSFHRLFAPAVPHTTSAAGRSCISCHNDPLALGYGRGTLTLVDDSTQWAFASRFAPLRDGLPADAWTPFLGTPDGPSATRLGARPFNRVEQQRILRVGACLTCHPDSQENRRRIYDDFEGALVRMAPECRATPVDTLESTPK